MSINVTRIRRQALVTTWSCTGLISFGIAWALGLQASWWQRALIALPLAVLAVLDARGAGPVMDARIALTRLIADIGWMQIPLAVAGGAWLAGLTPDVGTRLVLAAVLATVAGLFHLAPSAPAPAGGNS